MPLTRYQIRNEYGLADPELYRTADRDDAEEILEGVAMAGLVGVLRQLGDLAEFAAEIFHNLHEEVTTTAARGHVLMVRVQQLEEEFPGITKAILSQTNHSSFFSNAGVDWHPNLQTEQNLIARGDLPRCILDSYEECHGPPRLFLLDKFDISGAGACLKRYTDPSFFKNGTASEPEKLQTHGEKKSRKVKKKGSWWRNGETRDIPPTAHAKLHQLFLQEQVASGCADAACLVKLKRRQLTKSPLNSNSGRSYMEKLLQTPPPQHDTLPEISLSPRLLTSGTDTSSEASANIPEITTVAAAEKLSQGKEIKASVCNVKEVVPTDSADYLNARTADRDIEILPESAIANERVKIQSSYNMLLREKLLTDGKGRRDSSFHINYSGDFTSKVDNYMDAPASMESETATDNEYRSRKELGFFIVSNHMTDSDANEEQLDIPPHFSDSQSIGHPSVSDDGCSSFKKERYSVMNSDTVSILLENKISDVEESSTMLPSTETCTDEMVDAPFNQLPVDKGAVGSSSFEPVSVSARVADKDSINDLKEVSVSISSTEDSVFPSRDPEAIFQLGSEKLSIRELGINMVDSSAVSNLPCEARYNTVLTVPAETHLSNNLVGAVPDASSDVLLNLSALPDPGPEEKGCNIAVNRIVQTDYADNNHSEEFVNVESGSMQLFIPHSEKEFTHSTRQEIDVCSGALLLSVDTEVVKPDDDVTPEVDTPAPAAEIKSDDMPPLETDSGDMLANTPKDDYIVPASELSSENLFPVVSEADDTVPQGDEVNMESSSSSMQFSDSTQDDPPEELDVTHAGLSSEQNPNLELMSMVVDDSQGKDLLDQDNEAEGDADPLKFTTPYLAVAAHGDQIFLDSIATKTAQEGDITKSDAVDAIASTDADDVSPFFSSSICSPSNSIMDVQESLRSSGNKHQDQSDTVDTLSSGGHLGSEDQRLLKLLQVASVDLESLPSKLVTYGHSTEEAVNDVQDSSLVEPATNSLIVESITTVATSSKLRHLESETKYQSQSNLLENREYAKFSATSYLPDHKTVQSLKLQSLQMEHLPAHVENSEMLNDQLKHMQSLNCKDKERCLKVSPESCSDGLLSEHLSAETLPLSSGQEFHPPNKALGLDSLPPRFGLLAEASQAHLEEMPPLPPLPPVQWIGKLEPAAPTSHTESVKTTGAPFPATFSSAAGTNCRFILAAPNEESAPLTPVDEGKKEHVPQQFASYLVRPSPVFTQLATTVSDHSQQQNYIVSAKIQSKDLILTSSSTSNERQEHAFLNQEKHIRQSTSNPSLLAPAAQHVTLRQAQGPLQRTQVQPHSQSVQDTGFEGETREQISQKSGESENPSGTTSMMLEQRTKLEQLPQLVAHGSGAEIAQPENSSSSQNILCNSTGDKAWPANAFSLAPTFEGEEANENPTVKLPRPRSPIVDAVAVLDRSMLRKVSERVRPPVEPKVDEKDSLLEQIRTKSFNLRHAAVTRPNVQLGPKTNLKIVAILEKANTIRQAMAGRDEDDDSDSWSDS